MDKIITKIVILEQMSRLQHFKTTSYSFHKATDFLYSELNKIIDTLAERSKTNFWKCGDFFKIESRIVTENFN